MFRRFKRHIYEGFQGVIRHFGMAISSMSTVMITLLLVGVFVVLTYNLQIATKNIENSISLSALVSYNFDDENNLQRIESALRKIEGISEIKYSSKEDEFNFYVNANQDEELRKFYENYRSENPFHDAFILGLDHPELLETVKDAIVAIPGIEGVYDGGENTHTLVQILKNVRVFGAVLVVSLFLLAIYLVYNTIKITIFSRRDEIWIMRNVGAKNGYIRAPFLVEGIIIGFFGAIIPALVIAGLYWYLYQEIRGHFFGAFILVNPKPFILQVAGGLLLVGVSVGLIGSYISVWKYLRLKR